MSDLFRPRTEPARTIYDTLVTEAEHRHQRMSDWIECERTAVWKAARDYAQQHGMKVPTMAQVCVAERQACGHTDYAAQFAYGVAETMGDA